MKVKYIRFGGGFIEYPCYEDENGRIYFDLNDGKNGLDLYTGAYRHPEDRDICGEPDTNVKETIECDNPFVRNQREFDYMMLSRYKADCDYFLGNGNGYEGHLYYKDVNKHCDEMEKLYESFAEDEKPEWLTMEQIKEYREKNVKCEEVIIMIIPRIEYDKKLLGKLKSNYFNAKVLYECIETQAREIERKVLAENEFYETEYIAEILKKRGGNGEPRRILEPSGTFMMSEVDFQTYLDLVYPEYVKAGIADKRGRDYIPEAEARELYYEATKQLVKYGIDIIPDEFGEKETLRKAVQMIKWRDKVLEIVLRLESEEVENYAN